MRIEDQSCPPAPSGQSRKEQPPRRWPEQTILLTLEPRGGTRAVPRPKTAGQLLASLGMLEETALVIRDGALLTPDRAIQAGDAITVRTVVSMG